MNKLISKANFTLCKYTAKTSSVSIERKISKDALKKTLRRTMLMSNDFCFFILFVFRSPEETNPDSLISD